MFNWNKVGLAVMKNANCGPLSVAPPGSRHRIEMSLGQKRRRPPALMDPFYGLPRLQRLPPRERPSPRTSSPHPNGTRAARLEYGVRLSPMPSSALVICIASLPVVKGCQQRPGSEGSEENKEENKRYPFAWPLSPRRCPGALLGFAVKKVLVQSDRRREG